MKKAPYSLAGKRLAHLASTCLQGHSVENVTLRFINDELKLFLCRYKNSGKWGLPVSMIRMDESFGQAAIRLIKESHGIEQAFVKPFAVYSNPERGSPDWVIKMYEKLLEPDELYLLDWIKCRFISAGYLSFIQPKVTAPQKNTHQIGYLFEQIDWVSLDSLPTLVANHQEIIDRAMRQLRIELSYLPVAKELLPNEFTISELQKIYESILRKKVDRANFQRKMLKLGYLIRLDRKRMGVANRAPYLYIIDHAAYEQLMKDGIGYL